MVAESYQLIATGLDGHVAKCNTSVNNCSLDGLHCGQTYSLSITAKGATCRSLPSLSSFKTGKGNHNRLEFITLYVDVFHLERPVDCSHFLQRIFDSLS